MPTQLKHDTKLDKNKSLVLIIHSAEDLSGTDFTSEENAYVKEQIGNKSKLITLNRYSRRIYVLVTTSKPAFYSYHEELRKAGFNLLKLLQAEKTVDIYLSDLTGSKASFYVAEGLFLSNYQFDKYKTDKSSASSLQNIIITDSTIAEAEVNELNNLLNGVYLARDLVNEPHNFQSAEQLAETITAVGDHAGFNTEILDILKIQALKMGGLLAVNQGSLDPPTFSILEYKPENARNEKPYILVGKGVVYDTGGLSLKPTPNSMDMMKSDMAGAASVTGILYALAKNQIPLHVIGLIPATDNRPGGRAFAPGDVITMHSGATVEVLNTDAEGRLLLADALHFAKKHEPELVIDMATLTGAAARAVGREGIVMMSNAAEETKQKFKKAGETTYERLVELPLWEEYAEHLKSDIADLKNLGGPEAGAISAGKFLECFTSYPWIHLDIAGTAFLTSQDNYRGKNGTGSSVRLIYQFLTEMIKDNID
ncbi:leucyl aminopeptidase family protein [Adhaeribacter radiodurans]|uniref:Probable cytosol aminopeptidase n=1 Tax=Adhaeribacter radiodurans TaxID=2745197 RepID=A0A7L7L517_9BACT|nr:leucyl aminopeptidase [Adhaeribacter radiodurans]QMU27898.1 leucyl aminopeptidase [Adhaeribacter radiodurans]